MPPIEQEILQTKFSSEQHKAIVNIVYTGNWLTAKTSRFLKEFDITEPQFNILRILRGQAGKPASIALLKERMLDKMSDVSRLVERLRSAGLVDRKECPNDRRAVEIRITKQGLALLGRIDSNPEDMNALFTTLTNEELQFLNYLLDKLRGDNESIHEGLLENSHGNKTGKRNPFDKKIE